MSSGDIARIISLAGIGLVVYKPTRFVPRELLTMSEDENGVEEMKGLSMKEENVLENSELLSDFIGSDDLWIHHILSSGTRIKKAIRDASIDTPLAKGTNDM